MGLRKGANPHAGRGARRVDWPLTGAVGVEAAIVSWAFLEPNGLLIGLLVMGPLIAAAFSSVSATSALAAAGGISAGLLAARAGLLSHPAHITRVLGVVAGSSLAVFVALERRRRDVELRRVQRVADVAQSAILRPVPSQLGGLRCAARYQSATAEALVGGDFYEIIETPFGVRGLIGDVRGKGIDATRMAAVLLGCFREAAVAEGRLELVAKLLEDRAVFYGGDEDFATAVVLEFGDEVASVVNCGHPPPVRIGDGGIDVLASAPTPALGLGAHPREQRFSFHVGDTVLSFTDGLIEARDAMGRFFDVAGAIARAPMDADELLDVLLRRVTEHVGHRLDDDVALLAVSRSPLTRLSKGVT